MSTLLSCHRLAKTHGAKVLFEDLSLNVAPGERIGVLGANGAGKTSLLKILAGAEPPDAGERMQRRGLRIGFVEQSPRFAPGAAIAELLERPPPGDDPELHRRRAASWLTRLGFDDPARPAEALSGGWQKRLALARALAAEPELLLLDEPTNHLDLEGILWLQDLLAAARFAFVLVSHDRALLQAVCRRVIELDPRHPGGLLSIEGDYRTFLERRAELLAARAQHQQALENKVRREIEWLERGPKARATKAQGRIDQARTLMAELEQLRGQRPGQAAAIELAASGRRTRRLLTARGLAKSLGGKELFSGVDLLLKPGLKLGLVGPNGSGKTTLLKVLAGELAPDQGRVERADGLRLASFAQQRQEFDPGQSLKRCLAPDGDAVLFQGRSLHVVSWARRFGFAAEQLEAPVSSLSGGEQARIAIARLMLVPADVLLLDEPTNDLDIATLQALEDSLVDFEGAVVLVTHDRYLMDRVADLMLGLDGRGGASLVADIDQWERLVRAADETTDKKRPARAGRPRRSGPRGLGYLEKRELDAIEPAIEAAEARSRAARAALVDPAVATDAQALQERQAELEAAEVEVERLYDRWAELQAKQDAAADRDEGEPS